MTNFVNRWTDERVSLLKDLWAKGLTVSQIANEMACGFTRSAIIGKASRLNLPARLSPTTTRSERARTGKALAAALRGKSSSVRRPKIKTPKQETIPLPEDDVGNDVTRLLGVMDLTSNTCRFPIGDPLTGPFGFCGEKVRENSPYCAEHHARCYQGEVA